MNTAVAVLAVCFVLNMLGRGLGDSYAVFLLPLEREYGWTRYQLTSVYSVFLLVSGFAAPLIGLQFKIGLLVAAAAMAGDLLSSFSKRGWVLHPVVSRPGSTKFQKRSSVTRLPFCIFVNGDRYRGAGCVIFFVGEVLLSYLFFRLRLRDRRY